MYDKRAGPVEAMNIMFEAGTLVARSESRGLFVTMVSCCSRSMFFRSQNNLCSQVAHDGTIEGDAQPHPLVWMRVPY